LRVGKLAALLLAVFVGASCSAQHHATPELVVGSAADPESVLLADIYVAALRSYGFPARGETAPDPMAKLDSGEFTVVPAFTGRVLRRLQPNAPALSDAQVYRAMIAALPEGVLAGDYTTAAEDKPALVVTGATAKAWGGGELSEVPGRCEGLVLGVVSGARVPASVGSCPLPVPREFPDGTAMLAALRSGELTAAWTTTATPDTTDTRADLVVLADGKPALIQAENVLALNEVAGVLDTGALADMRRQVAAGTDPQAVAGGWLADHPLGR
jgi:glycine betaine/choline ABC-type transport system substrate-binding protein